MDPDWWPHAPLHQLSETGTYFVTAGTLHKQHFFRGYDSLSNLQKLLLEHASKHNWRLEAWAVFSNHYHFIGHSPEDEPDAGSLRGFLAEFHQHAASWVNAREGHIGREVWYNFRDTRLTFLKSYLARLNYVHQNAVHHRLVPLACQYPFCSAGWFESRASLAQVRSIYRFKVDKLNVPDDYEVSPDW
jgi:putative transposase